MFAMLPNCFLSNRYEWASWKNSKWDWTAWIIGRIVFAWVWTISIFQKVWMSCYHICVQCLPIAFYLTGNNVLTGEIPSQIGNLCSLEYLYLSKYEHDIVWSPKQLIWMNLYFNFQKSMIWFWENKFLICLILFYFYPYRW